MKCKEKMQQQIHALTADAGQDKTWIAAAVLDHKSGALLDTYMVAGSKDDGRNQRNCAGGL